MNSSHRRFGVFFLCMNLTQFCKQPKFGETTIMNLVQCRFGVQLREFTKPGFECLFFMANTCMSLGYMVMEDSSRALFVEGGPFIKMGLALNTIAQNFCRSKFSRIFEDFVKIIPRICAHTCCTLHTHIL